MEMERIIRRDEVLKITGLTKSSLYRSISEGEFPRQVRLGKNSVGWHLSSVLAWVHSRPVVEERLTTLP
jgi:prophage regulatory protein